MNRTGCHPLAYHNSLAATRPTHLPHLPHLLTCCMKPCPIMHQPPASALAADLPPISPRLYNQDLAPTKAEGRRWSGYNIFALWANDVHSLGNYWFAIGSVRPRPRRLADPAVTRHRRRASVRAAELVRLHGPEDRCSVPGDEPHHFRHPRSADPALIRGVVAIVWFGIQTYLASLVLRVLLIALAPGLDRLDHNSILGLSTLGWLTFVVLWLVQAWHGAATAWT